MAYYNRDCDGKQEEFIFEVGGKLSEFGDKLNGDIGWMRGGRPNRRCHQNDIMVIINSGTEVQHHKMSQKVTLYMALLSLIPPPTLSGLNQLCELIDFYEHAKHTASCVMYDYYGCWCGPGGSGKPVDETDQCCQAHDYCYDKIIAEKEVPYFHQYNWHNGTCDDAPGTVLYQICDCDRTIAICLSQHKFNWKHWGSRFWPGYCEDNRKRLEKFRFV